MVREDKVEECKSGRRRATVGEERVMAPTVGDDCERSKKTLLLGGGAQGGRIAMCITANVTENERNGCGKCERERVRE